MTEQDLVGAARGIVEAFNASDWEGYEAALAPDCVYDEVGSSRSFQGTDEIIACLKSWKKAMPDVTGTINSALATGNSVVLEITWEGTHTGPLDGPGGTVEATGKHQTTRAGWVLEFDDGKNTVSRHYFDMLSFLQQLDVLP